MVLFNHLKKLINMARITQQVKAIADAHIEARKTGKFDNPKVSTAMEVFRELRMGKTFEEVMREIEVRYCSIGSILMSTQLNHTSKSYRDAVYKGFKILFNNKN